MVVEIDSRNPRSVAAIGLMVRAKGWAAVRTRDGQRFYGIPSRTRPGLIHLADAHTCTCEDHRFRETECSHILAARLHEAQLEARAQLKARASERNGQRRQRQFDPRRVAALSAEYSALFPSEE